MLCGNKNLFSEELFSFQVTRQRFPRDINTWNRLDILSNIANDIVVRLSNATFVTNLKELSQEDAGSYKDSVDAVANYICKLYYDFCDPNAEKRRLTTINYNETLENFIKDTVNGYMYGNISLSVERDIESKSDLQGELITWQDLSAQTTQDALDDIYGRNGYVDYARRMELARTLHRMAIVNIEGKNPGIVNSAKDLNNAVRDYQEAQYKILRDYLISQGYSARLLPKLLYSSEFGIRNNAVDSAFLMMHNHIVRTMSRENLMDMLDLQHMKVMAGDNTDRTLLDAVNAYINLRYFDEWIEDAFGNIIKINRDMPLLIYQNDLVGGSSEYVYRYNFSYDMVEDGNFWSFTDFIDANEQLKKYSKILISTIDMYDYTTGEFVFERMTPLRFVAAFCLLLDAAMKIPYAEKGYRREFVDAIILLQDKPHQQLKQVFKLLFRDNAELLYDDLHKAGLTDSELNTLYSVYKAMYVDRTESHGSKGTLTYHTSFESMEADYLSENGVHKRYNLMDTLLGVIKSNVKNTYLQSIVGTSGTTTEQASRFSYRRNTLGIYLSINNSVIDMPKKDILIGKYSLYVNTSPALDCNYIVDVAGKFKIAFRTGSRYLLDKKDFVDYNVSLLVNVKDPDTGLVEEKEIKLPEMKLKHNQRIRLLNDDNLSDNEQLFKDLLIFAGDMLQLNFVSEDGLREFALMQYLPDHGKDSLKEAVVTAARALLIMRIYSEKNRAKKPDGSPYSVFELSDFLDTDECIAITNGLRINNIASTLYNEYFFNRSDGLLLATIHQKLVFLKNMGIARSIALGDSVEAITYSNVHTQMPTYSPFSVMSHIKQFIMGTALDSAMGKNFFKQALRFKNIHSVCTSLEVTGPNGTTKNEPNLNEKELLFHRFVNTWMVPLYEDGKIYSLPHCIADKSRIPMIEILFKDLFELKGDTYMRDLVSPEFHLKLIGYFADSIGETYKESWREIVKDYMKICPGLADVGEADLAEYILKWLKKEVKTQENLLKLVDEYNAIHGQGALVFTREMHYRIYNGTLSLNEILYNNVYRRFATHLSTEVALTLATRAFVQQLLNNGVEFHIDKDTGSDGKETIADQCNAISSFFNATGLSLSEWTSGNKMIIAKIDGKPVRYGKLKEGTLEVNPIIKAFVLSESLISNNLSTITSGLDINMEVGDRTFSEFSRNDISFINKNLSYTVNAKNITLTDVAIALMRAKANGSDPKNIKSIEDKYKKSYAKIEEVAQTQLSKRNMISTATMRLQMQGTLNGLGEYLNVVVVDDYTAKVYGFSDPRQEDMLPADGLIWMDGITSVLANWGLLDQRGNDVTKPIFYFRDDRTATSGLIKCGAATITNNLRRMSADSTYRLNLWFKKMTNHRLNGLVDFLGICKLGNNGEGFLIDFKEHILLGNRLYYLRQNGLHAEITGFGKEDLGNGNYVYYTEERLCDTNGITLTRDTTNEDGSIKKTPIMRRVYHLFDADSAHRRVEDLYIYDPESIPGIEATPELIATYNRLRNELIDRVNGVLKNNGMHTIDSLYELHTALGAEYAEEMGKNGSLVYSEKNYETVANFVVHVTDANGRLVLKDRQAHILAMQSAFKRGAGNINSSASLRDNTPFRFMRLRSLYYGKVLDSDHNIDDAKVTEMSLMVTSLGSAGFALTEVREIFKTLENIAESMSSAELESFDKWIQTGNRSEVYGVLLRIMTSYFRSRTGGELGKALINNISKGMNDNADHSFDKKKLAFSNSDIYAQLVPVFASVISTKSLTRKYPGIGNVIITSQGICQLYEFDNTTYQFEDVLRMARDSGIHGNTMINDLSEYNKDLVHRYLVLKLNALPEYDNVERFKPVDNVLFIIRDTNNRIIRGENEQVLTPTLSLDTLDTYWDFKEKPFETLIRDKYGFIENESGDLVSVRDMSPEEHEANLAEALMLIKARNEGATITYKHNIMIPRDLRPKDVDWVYEVPAPTAENPNATVKHYMNIFDDYRFKKSNKNNKGEDIVDRNTLFTELFERKYAPVKGGTKYNVTSVRNRPMEAIIPNLYRSKFAVDGMSLAEIIDTVRKQGPSIFVQDLPPVNFDNCDVAFLKLDGSHELISFQKPNKQERLGINRIVKIAVDDNPEGLVNRVYLADGLNNALYEIGREFKVTDENVSYHNGVFWEGETLALKSQKYILLNDGSVGLYILFVSLSKRNVNGKNTLIHHINYSELSRAKLANENEGELVASILADIYNNNRFTGILLNNRLSDLSKTLLQNAILPLAQRLSYDKYLSYYLSKDVANLLEHAIYEYGNVPETQLLYREWKINGNYAKKAFDRYRNSLARAIYSSFGLSLYFSTARIPGQGALTTRQVKAVTYFTSGLNQVAISHFNLWLEGSDCDNDHEWFMGYGFDGNGLFVGWSNMFDYSSYSSLKASLLLPMPKMKAYNIASRKGNGVKDISKYVLILLSHRSKSPYKTFDREGLETFATMLRELNDEDVLTIYVPDEDTAAIVELIQSHEDTILPMALKEMALKNFVNAGIQRVTLDLRNTIAMYKPTGMARLKKLGDQISHTDNTLNPGFKYYLLHLNLSAKNTVGIMANGMSTAFSWLYYLNDMLSDPARFEEYGKYNFKLSRIIGRAKYNKTHKSSDLTTKVINTLPDLNVGGNSDERLRKLVKLATEVSMAESLSEYITGATDNAKNPTLFKINATQNLAGMHLLLITQGVSMEDTVAFMTSPVARFIALLSAGDMFSNWDIKLSTAIEIAKGDYSKIVKRFTDDALDGRLTEEEIKKLNRGETDSIDIKSLTAGSEDYDAYHDMVDLIEKIKSMRGYNIDDPNMKADVDEFENVYDAANEFSALGIDLGMKTKLKSSKEELYKQFDTLKRSYDIRVSKYNNDIQEGNIKGEPIALKSLSIDDFLKDRSYREKIALNYKKVKKVVNIYDMLNRIPQYLALFKLINMQYVIDKRISVRSRIYDSIRQLVQSGYGDITERAQLHIIDGIDDATILAFLREKKFYFPYLPGYNLISENMMNDYKNDSGFFSLATIEGIASFKRVMEEQVMPMLKLGSYYDGVSDLSPDLLASNTFIRSLMIDTSRLRPVIRTNMNMYNIDRSETNRISYERIKRGLKQLQDKYIYYVDEDGNTKGMSIADWFALYNLIVHKNRAGRDRMSMLFSDDVMRENSLIDLYNTWLGNLDYEDGIPDFSFVDILIGVAPVVRTKLGLQDLMIWLLTNEGQHLYRRTSNGKYVRAEFLFFNKGNDLSEDALKELMILYNNYYCVSGIYRQNISDEIDAIKNIKPKKVDERAYNMAYDTWRDLMRRGFVNPTKEHVEGSKDKYVLTILVADKNYKLNIKSTAAKNALDDMIDALADRKNEVLLNHIINDNGALLSTMLKNPAARPVNIGNKEIINGWNYTVEDIAKRHPNANIPKGVKANFYLVSSFKRAGSTFMGRRIISKEGIEVFPVRDNLNEINRIMDILDVRNKIKAKKDLFDRDSETYKQLAEIYKLKNKKGKSYEVTPSQILEMLVHFMENRSLYDNIYINKRNATSILNPILRKIRDLSDLISYDDNFISSINSMLIFGDDNKAKIPVEKVFKALQEAHPASVKKMSTLHDFQEAFGKGDTPFADLFNQCLSTEPEFWWRYDSIDSSKSTSYIVFRKVKQNVRLRYGGVLALDTTYDYGIEPYRGFNIYSKVGTDGEMYYFADKALLDGNSIPHRHKTQAEAKADVDRIVDEKLSIRNGGLLHFKMYSGDSLDSRIVHSPTELRANTTIGVLDIPLKKDTKFVIGEEEFRSGYKKLSDFNDMIDRWVRSKIIAETTRNIIKDAITDPERAMTFLYLLNERCGAIREGKDVEMVEIANKIKKAKMKYYYIDSAKYDKYKRIWLYHVIPTNFTSIEQVKSKPREPIRSFMDKVVTSINKHVKGVAVDYVTSEDIRTQFKGVVNPDAKAFIHEGTIYINLSRAKSSDMVHEYVHLFLSVMKANPNTRENYELLMYAFSRTNRYKNSIDKLRKAYPNAPEIDLMEEAFVKAFGYFATDNMTKLEELLFLPMALLLTSSTRSLFDSKPMADEGKANYISSVKKFFSGSIDQAFMQFNNDVANLINTKKGIEFDDKIINLRKIVNWISKLIRDTKEILEICN